MPIMTASYGIESLIVDGNDTGRGPSSIMVRRRVDEACHDLAIIHADTRRAMTVIVDPVSKDGNGYLASEALFRSLPELSRVDASGMSGFFTDADIALANIATDSEASSVGVIFEDGVVSGSSAGDCEAWYVPMSGEPIHLTEHQNRRPRIGSTVSPVEFRIPVARGIVISASDGLWVNVNRREVFEIVRAIQKRHVPRALVQYVFERNGGSLMDDMAIAVIEA